jgi:serine O-acetyltransferase
MREQAETDRCAGEVETGRRQREAIPGIVDELIRSSVEDECFEHLGPEPLPSRDAIIDLIHRALRILFPGYFASTQLDTVNLGYHYGVELTSFYEVLAEQISHAIRHDCLRHQQTCSHCEQRGREVAAAFLKSLPGLRRRLARDVRAAYDGDPAAKSHDEIIFSYPGLLAIAVYRCAHPLERQRVPLIPRIMAEYAHSRTGIDIHPGARIGESFFIDHGTGVVIGATTEIGDRVRIYQGVTLGALSLPKNAVEQLRTEKRHPTIEDDVILYAGATILGGSTVIGARAIIGGNVWITESVPPDTKVFLKRPELVYTEKPRPTAEVPS